MSRQHALAALLFAALAVAFTWPLVLNLNRAAAEPGDAYINTWVLDWDWYATLHQPLSLYDANMLRPAKYSLAMSENLYGVAMLLFPLRAAGVSPIAAYNVAFLLGLALAGFGAYLLGWRLTRSFFAGVAAGIFFAFAHIAFTHLQHVWSGWLPLLLVALLDYAERPAWKRATVFAALFAMNGLTNIHYLLFGSFAIAVTAALLVRSWRNLAIATAIAFAILAPFLYPYAAAAKLYGLERTYAESAGYSATPSDWIRSDAKEPERHVAPGAIALILAVLAIASRAWAKLALAAIWIAIGFAGSLGMNFEFHRFLFGAIPGFRAVRVPARWAIIAYIGIAILIALTTAMIARRARWLAPVVPVVIAIAIWRAPIRWYMTIPQAPEVYRWIASTRGTIAELPMGTYDEYEYYLRATVHHRPSVNGNVGTPVRRKLADQWAVTPIADDFLDTLAHAGVEHVIVHAGVLGERSPVVREWLQRELDRGRLFFVRDFAGGGEGDWVFSLHGTRAYSETLARFLFGASTCSRSLFGVLETPLPKTYKGRLTISGWAISPSGIQSAFVYFDNRTVRYPLPIAHVRGSRCWFYPPAAHARYDFTFPSRPPNVRRDTDVQVDVTDSAGNVWTSDNRWFRWE